MTQEQQGQEGSTQEPLKMPQNEQELREMLDAAKKEAKEQGVMDGAIMGARAVVNDVVQKLTVAVGLDSIEKDGGVLTPNDLKDGFKAGVEAGEIAREWDKALGERRIEFTARPSMPAMPGKPQPPAERTIRIAPTAQSQGGSASGTPVGRP